jgi:hypothetical protein
MDGTVLESPALPLLIELEEAGFDIRLADDERLHVAPGSKLTEVQRRLLVEHKLALIMILRVCDAGVVERREVFRRQLAETPAPTIPAFLFVSDVPYVIGRCFSCGEGTSQPTHGRCWRCSLAWRLACRLPIPTDMASAIDTARRVA